MGGKGGTHGRGNELSKKSLSRKLMRRGHLGDMGAEHKIIAKLAFQRVAMKLWTKIQMAHEGLRSISGLLRIY
jgi:hypothetical protein